MAKTDDTLDRYATKDVTGVGMLNRFDAATAKFKNGAGRGSIVKSAQGNVFEFPVFVSSSVPMDYATATTSLLEQIYAAYLQMAISINPVVDADSVKKGLQFADFKVDTNKYLEYTELDYQHDTCHAEYVEENAKFTFDLLSVTDSEARLINEAVDYQPLSEFEHFFQEADDIPYGDQLQLYPVPEIVNGHINTDTDMDRGESYYVIPTNTSNVQFATYDEIIKMLEDENATDVDVAKFKANIGNTLSHYGIGNIHGYDYTNAQTKKDQDTIKNLQTIASVTTPAEFESSDVDFIAARDLVDRLNSKYPGLRESLNATMRDVERARKEIEARNTRDQTHNTAQENLWKAQQASANASAAYTTSQKKKLDTDTSEINGTTYDKDVENQRRINAARAIDAERANKDLAYKGQNISADDFAAAQRASAQARAEIDRRNAEIANSRYYQALNAINTGAQTVGNVANAVNSSINAVNSTANAIYNVKTLNTRIDNDKLNNQLLQDRIDNLDTDRALRKTEVNAKAAARAPQYVDDSKCQKLNTMKPLLMNVTINMLNKDDSLQPINYVIGVKTRSRVVPASILPEVAKYPLKEMDKISRKIKWRAGELKFFKDLIFRINEKKQTAADSRDPNRKWYRRLYELAHMKGDAPTTAVVQGKSLFKTFLQAKQGKDKLKHGLIPNASIIMSQNDVDNIKNQTNIDLLKAGAAKKFCGELFLLSFIIIDLDAESIKVLLPDQYADFDVQDLGAVKKQLAALDTSGTKTRDMFKLLG